MIRNKNNLFKVRRNLFALLLNLLMLYSSGKGSGGREFQSLVVRGIS